MEFERWEPVYERILEEFGYSYKRDRRAARLLDRRLRGSDRQRLEEAFGNEKVAVVGNAPSLEAENVPEDSVVVAADGAAKRLGEAGVGVDAVVTDLDGAPKYAAEASHEGTAVAVHAHGDNTDALERYLQDFDLSNVLGTTQVDPRGFDALYNFGGFTDGDRAAFIMDGFGATHIELVGFDFEAAEGEKRHKLRWARRLLRVLGEERGEILVG